MLWSRMQEYEIQEPYLEEDDYNFQQPKWRDAGTALVYITHSSTSDYQSNDFELISTQFIGHTTNEFLQKDWLIDGTYKVEYAAPAKHGRTLYLSTLGGREYE